MPKKSSTPEPAPFIVTHKLTVLCLLTFGLLVLSSTIWWNKVYIKPERVFRGMISNNLSISSITRTTKSDTSGSVTEKVEQLSFVPEQAVHTWTGVTQPGVAKEKGTKVITETIGNMTTDFSRYLSIQTSQKGADGKPLNYSRIENLWGASDTASGGGQYFQQASLGLVPFVNLPFANKDAAVDQMIDKDVYTIDYAKVKPKQLNGKSALVFPVKVNLSNYIKAFKSIAKQAGLGEFKELNPDDYQASAPVEISLTIDKRSRQLLEIVYPGDAQQTESFSGHGQSLAVTVPTKTIPIEQLQQKIQEIK